MRKFPTWLPALVVFAGGVAAMRAANVGVFADQSQPARADRGMVETEAAGGSTPSSTYHLASRWYQPGDCVRWDQSEDAAETRATRVVPCDQPHLMEMTGRAVMPILKTYPSEEEWRRIVDEGDCGKQVAAYLGGEIDPYGRFGAGALEPTFESWLTGDRELWCGVLQRSSEAYPNEDLETFTGAVKSQPQGFVHPAGTCLAEDAATLTTIGRVPCNEAHIYEIVGDVDAGAAFSSPPAPDSEVWNTKLAPACEALARKAFNGNRIPNGVEVSVSSIDPASWRTGERRAACNIARFDASRHPIVLTAPLLPAR